MFFITTVVGEPKYPFLSVLVITVHILLHSNTDVEGSLSVDNRMVTMGKTQLSETAINGLRSTKDYLKFCNPAGMHPEKICINKNLLSTARKAYSLYNTCNVSCIHYLSHTVIFFKSNACLFKK